MVIDATRLLRAKGFRAKDGSEIVVRIEHCGLPTTAQSAELADLKIVAVAQPLHHHNWGDGVVTAVGEAVGGRFNPLANSPEVELRTHFLPMLQSQNHDHLRPLLQR